MQIEDLIKFFEKLKYSYIEFKEDLEAFVD